MLVQSKQGSPKPFLKRLFRAFQQRSVKVFSLLFAVGLGLSLAISACTPSNSASSSSAPAATPAKSVIRVGYQKYGTVNILKAQGGLEKRLESLGVSVEWTEFPGGPQLLEALNVGSIDFGHTGEAPPIFAQAAGAPLVYVANEPASPASEAILVAKDSPIKSVADLKGKKVALNKGSNVHYLLVQALAAAGLKYNEIQPVYLPPAEGRVAFQQGKVDAWVIWDPFFGAAQKATEARVLADGKDLVANREFYLAERKFADQHADLVQAVIEEIQKIDAWAADKPTEVAKLLSPQLGIEVPVLEQVARRRNYGAQLIQPDVVAYQQKVADTFFELGLIPKKLTVQEAVWTPKA